MSVLPQRSRKASRVLAVSTSDLKRARRAESARRSRKQRSRPSDGSTTPSRAIARNPIPGRRSRKRRRRWSRRTCRRSSACARRPPAHQIEIADGVERGDVGEQRTVALLATFPEIAVAVDPCRQLALSNGKSIDVPRRSTPQRTGPRQPDSAKHCTAVLWPTPRGSQLTMSKRACTGPGSRRRPGRAGTRCPARPARRARRRACRCVAPDRSRGGESGRVGYRRRADARSRAARGSWRTEIPRWADSVHLCHGIAGAAAVAWPDSDSASKVPPATSAMIKRRTRAPCHEITVSPSQLATSPSRFARPAHGSLGHAGATRRSQRARVHHLGSSQCLDALEREEEHPRDPRIRKTLGSRCRLPDE